MIDLYKNNASVYHQTNNGNFKFFLKEYNDLIYTKSEDVVYSKFLLLIQKYTGVNKPSGILYIKGDINEFAPFDIGEGAEARVINNTPFSVLKLLSVSPKLMKERNVVPTSVPCSLRAIIEQDNDVTYIYHQSKVNMIPEEDLSFAFKRLDIIMMQCGFFLVIGYSDDKIRVYTDGFSVIDDIGYGNIGTGLDGKIHIVDCAVFDIDDWELMNNVKVPNKVACIAYNNGDATRQIDGHLKAIAKDITNAIREYELVLDKYLEENKIDFKYDHIKDEY